MQLRYVDANPADYETPLLGVAVFQGTEDPTESLAGLDERLGGLIARSLESGDMKGRKDQEVLLYASADGPERVLLLGGGKEKDASAETVRRMAGRLVRAAERLGLERASLALSGLERLNPEAAAQAAAEGAALAAWRFTELKTPSEDAPVTQVRAVDLVGSGNGDAFGRGTMAGAAIARTLHAPLRHRPKRGAPQRPGLCRPAACLRRTGRSWTGWGLLPRRALLGRQ